MYFSIMNTSINCDKECKLTINRNENAFDVAHRLDSLNCINSPYSFIYSMQYNDLEDPDYLDIAKANNVYPIKKAYDGNLNTKNIVLIARF